MPGIDPETGTQAKAEPDPAVKRGGNRQRFDTFLKQPRVEGWQPAPDQAFCFGKRIAFEQPSGFLFNLFPVSSEHSKLNQRGMLEHHAQCKNDQLGALRRHPDRTFFPCIL
jgi:hypothetical protein